jgi:LysR substrate binding domain
MISLKVATAVRAGTATVGIARVPPGAGLATMVLAQNPLNAVAMPVSHPLSSRETLEPGDLTEETVIAPSRSLGGEGRAALAVRFRDAEVTSEGELLDLVSAGFGLLVTTEGLVRRNPRHDIVVRPLEGDNGWSRDLLVWRVDDDTPIRRAICEIAEEVRPELASIAG